MTSIDSDYLQQKTDLLVDPPTEDGVEKKRINNHLKNANHYWFIFGFFFCALCLLVAGLLFFRRYEVYPLQTSSKMHIEEPAIDPSPKVSAVEAEMDEEFVISTMSGVPLFEPGGSDAISFIPEDEQDLVIRARYVELNEALYFDELEELGSEHSQQLLLNLFPDTILEASATAQEIRRGNSLSWRMSDQPGEPYFRVLISFVQEYVIGSVWYQDQVYQLEAGPGPGIILVTELDPTSFGDD